MSGVYLGFDYGQRRIGIASGQALTGSAGPLETAPATRGEPDWPRIDRLVADWRPDGLVVGIPVHMDGTEQPLTGEARAFARRLGERYRLPVFEADERGSSREAAAAIAAGRQSGTRRRTRRGDVDRMSATVILQHWLADHAGD